MSILISSFFAAIECNVWRYLQRPVSVNCLCVSPDDLDVVVGQANGLVTFKALTMELVASWTDELADIYFLHVTSLSEAAYLITTIDKLGRFRDQSIETQILFLKNTLHLHIAHK